MEFEPWTITKENRILRRLSREHCIDRKKEAQKIKIMNGYIKHLQDKLDDNTIPFELIDKWKEETTKEDT